ncbi:hypothetical protein, partial [Mycolicibacterium gadium]|uniref:hypothetical protein n=1 Tax=Mycolicibacterium gadium TaxID=1794 RepID=UPI00355784AF
LAQANMTIGDIDLYEINEAFAVQVLGSARALGMDEATSTRSTRHSRSRCSARRERSAWTRTS